MSEIGKIEKHIADLQWQLNFADKLLCHLPDDFSHKTCWTLAYWNRANKSLGRAQQAFLEANLKPIQEDLEAARKSHKETAPIAKRLSGTVNGYLRASDRG